MPIRVYADERTSERTTDTTWRHGSCTFRKKIIIRSRTAGYSTSFLLLNGSATGLLMVTGDNAIMVLCVLDRDSLHRRTQEVVDDDADYDEDDTRR